jgi:hypothetical protein
MSTLTCRLLSIRCFMSDEANRDEVFIRYRGKKIWPKDSRYIRMEEDQLPVKAEIAALEKDTEVMLELWDYDLFTPNDLLGTFTMRIDERGGPFLVDLVRTDVEVQGRYQLEYEVV